MEARQMNIVNVRNGDYTLIWIAFCTSASLNSLSGCRTLQAEPDLAPEGLSSGYCKSPAQGDRESSENTNSLSISRHEVLT
jgi:hypothetical protein